MEEIMNRDSVTQIMRLSDAQKNQMIGEIKAFYLDVRGEEIGMIEQQQILDLFCEHMAPIIYNKALDDAQYWYKQQMENLSLDYYMLYKDF